MSSTIQALAIDMLAAKRSPRDVARHLGVTRSVVYHWQIAHRKGQQLDGVPTASRRYRGTEVKLPSVVLPAFTEGTRARIDREIAAGDRCAVCFLLVPHVCVEARR